MNGFQAIPVASQLLACPWPGVILSSRDGKKTSYLPLQARRFSVSSNSRARGFSSLGVHCASSSSGHNSNNSISVGVSSGLLPSGTQPYAEEPTTGVKFARSVMVPGCPCSLALLGTGYREKVFAIIGVKVYAAALYANQLIIHKLSAWKGKSKAEIHCDESFFKAVFHSQLEKSLQIVLVRDIDGETFWDAFDDAISPRIPVPTPIDRSALSTFRSIFKGRPQKKGTFIFLTWLDSSKMLVSVSSNGWATAVDAEIESENVTFSIFDVFLGAAPVSPSLKASAASGLAAALK